MIERAWMLMLALGLCLAMPGCGDDDSGGEEDGSNNAGTGSNAGRGGSSSAGRGGSSAGSGSSSDPGSIAECMAEEMMGSGGMTDCEGIEEYGACIQEMCLNDCSDQGCQAYFDCVEDAADPCNPTGCQPNSDCTNCLAGAADCFADCINLLMCGETTAGGACDQLDDCCADQPEQSRMFCEQGASAARAGGGDSLCEMLLGSLCMM